MGTMPVGKLLVSMSLPMIASMLVQAFYNVVDTVFVSYIPYEGDGASPAVAALSIAFIVQNLQIAVGVGTGVGVNALISRNLGKKDFAAANAIAANGMFLAACNYVFFLLLGLFAVRPFVQLMNQSDPAVVEAGVSYLSIILIFSFGSCAQLMVEKLMQSTGRTMLSMYTQGLGAVINIVLDPFFILDGGTELFGGVVTMPFGLGLGVAGAAMATVIGQILSAIFGIIINHKLNRDVHLSFRGFKPSWKLIKEIYVIGIPSIIMGSIGSVMTGGLNLIFNGFGAMTTAAQNVLGIYFKLQSFVFMPVFGLNNGLIPIVAYNYGAQKRKRIVRVAIVSCLFALCFMAAGLVLMQIIPAQMLGIFNVAEGASEMRIGVQALRTISLSFIFAGISITIGGVFSAFGKSLFSMFVSIARQLLVLLPVAYLLAQTADGLIAIWWAFPIAELMSIIASVVFLAVLWHKTIKHLPDDGALIRSEDI
jgi:putative MATE family efflux protein